MISLVVLCGNSFASYYPTLKDNAFDPGRGKTILTLFVTNDSDQMKAIELSSFRRDLKLNGEEIQTETEDILLIPSQLIIPPKTEKAVSMRWVGPKMIRQELSYRVILNEVDIGRKQKINSKMIKTKIKFVKAIYVAPKKVIESIVLLKAYREITKDGSNQLMLEIANNGTVHLIFHNIAIEYNTIGRKISSIMIESKNIEPMKKSINILPGRIIKGWIPWPDNIETSVERFNMIGFNFEEESEEDKKKK
tara:strand:+ start:615 stop:1364 length:750 start_codon:yes stop_codon:yes gene_type:complete